MAALLSEKALRADHMIWYQFVTHGCGGVFPIEGCCRLVTCDVCWLDGTC